MHIESLEPVHREYKNLAPIQKVRNKTLCKINILYLQKISRLPPWRELEIPEGCGWGGGGVSGPGNSEGERGFKAKFISRWSEK